MKTTLFTFLIFTCSLAVAQNGDIEYPLNEGNNAADKLHNDAQSDQSDLTDEPLLDPIEEAQKNPKPKKKKEKLNFKEDEDDISDLSQLGTFAPFSDIAVIQRRFLPKSSRFEFYPSIGAMVNNPFFFNSMAGLRLAYNLTEKWGIEADFGYIMSARQRVTKDLEEQKQVFTSSFIIPKMYFGADIRWSPIYGKMGFFNDSIVPFDMYFSGGGGITTTNQDTSPVTFHLGTGQIFALSKSLAARWDVSAYMYSSTTSVPSTGVQEGSFIDLYVSLGMSFFFPGASYR